MVETKTLCDLCDLEVPPSVAGHKVLLDVNRGNMSIEYDLCPKCWASGSSHRSVFKRVWALFAGTQQVSEKKE